MADPFPPSPNDAGRAAAEAARADLRATAGPAYVSGLVIAVILLWLSDPYIHWSDRIVGPDGIPAILFSVGFLLLYGLPAALSRLRAHPQALAITVLNLAFGWTLLAWAAALIWSLTVPRPRL